MILLILSFEFLRIVHPSCRYSSETFKNIYISKSYQVKFDEWYQYEQVIGFWLRLNPLLQPFSIIDPESSDSIYYTQKLVFFKLQSLREPEPHFISFFEYDGQSLLLQYSYQDLQLRKAEGSFVVNFESWVIITIKINFEIENSLMLVITDPKSLEQIQVIEVNYEQPMQELNVEVSVDGSYQSPKTELELAYGISEVSSLIYINDLYNLDPLQIVLEQCQISDYYSHDWKYKITDADFSIGTGFKVFLSAQIPGNIYSLQGWVKLAAPSAVSGSQEQAFIGINYKDKGNLEDPEKMYEIAYSYYLSNDAARSGFEVALSASQTYNNFWETFAISDLDLKFLTEWHYFRISFLESSLLFFQITFGNVKYSNVWKNKILANENTVFLLSMGGQIYQKEKQHFQGNVDSFYFTYNPEYKEEEVFNTVCHHTCAECTGPSETDCLSCSENHTYDQRQRRCQCFGNLLDQTKYKCLPLTYDYYGVQLLRKGLLSQVDGYDRFDIASSQCSFGYFSYLNQFCIKWYNLSLRSPGKMNETLVECSDCLFNPKIWSEETTCSQDFVAFQNNRDFVYLKKEREENRVEKFEVIFSEGQPILRQVLPLDRPQDCTPNCLTCLSGTCWKCKPGYYYSTYKTCLQCGINCEICSESRCHKCVDQQKYFLTYDAINCIPCLIEKCKYCYQFSTSSSKPTTTLDYDVFSINLEFVKTGCAVCETGYNFSGENNKCIEDSTIDILDLQQGCDELRVMDCKKCINSSQPFCYECQDGYYLNVKTKLCQKGNKQNCLVYGTQDAVFEDSWKQELIKFYYLSYRLNYQERLFDKKNLDYYKPICKQCVNGFTVDKGECVKGICNQKTCQECKIHMDKVTCVRCLNTPALTYSRFVNEQSPESCVICQKIYDQCALRTSKNDVNLIYSGEKQLNALTYFNVFSSSLIDWDGFLMVCPKNEKCQNALKITINLYCNASDFEKAKGTVILTLDQAFEQNIFGSKLESFLSQFSAPNFVLKLTELFVREVNILIMVFDNTQGECTFLTYLEIKNTFSELIYSINNVSIEIRGAVNTVILECPLTNCYFKFSQFNMVKIKNIKFFISKGTETQMSEQRIIVSNEYYPAKVLLENITFAGGLRKQVLAGITVFLFSSIDIKNLVLENMEISSDILFNFNNKTLNPIMLRIDGLRIFNCKFTQQIIFKILSTLPYGEEQNKNHHIISLENIVIENSYFLDNSNFFQTQGETGMTWFSFTLNQINLNGVVLMNSIFFNTKRLLNGSFNKIQARGVSLSQSKFIWSNILFLEEFRISDSKLLNEATLISNSQPDLNGQVWLQESIIKLSKLTFSNIEVGSKKSLIMIEQFQIRDLNVQISVLESKNIKLNPEALDSISQRTHDSTHIFISAFKTKLNQIQLERSNFLSELTFNVSSELVIEKLTVSGNSQNDSPLLGYQKQCYKGNRIYNYLLYIQTPKILIMRNLVFSDLLTINNPLIIIYSISQRTLAQEEMIEFDNMKFEDNLLIVDNFQAETSLIVMISEQNTQLVIKNSQFNRNHLHSSVPDSQISSATTLKIQLNNGKVTLLNNLFKQNLATNTTRSLLTISSLQIDFQSCYFIASNVIEHSLNLKNLNDSDHTKEIFQVQSNGGCGSIEAQAITINECQINGAYGYYGGGLYIVTLQEGFISITNSTVKQSHTTLNPLLESKGGFLYIDSRLSQLNLFLQNLTVEDTYARSFGGMIYIDPSKQTNIINLSNITVIDSFSIQHGILSISCLKTSYLVSNILLQSITIMDSDDGFSSFIKNAGYLTQGEIELLQQSNPLIYISFSNISISNLKFFNILYQQLLSFKDIQVLKINQLEVNNIRILFQPLIQIGLDPSALSELKAEEIYISNVIQHSSWLIHPTVCQKAEYIKTYQELYCYSQSQPFEIENASAIYQENCWNSLFYRGQQQSTSILVIEGINQAQVALQEFRLSNVLCDLCAMGLFQLKVTEADFKYKIKIEKLVMENNECGNQGCLSIVNVQFQDFSFLKFQSLIGRETSRQPLRNLQDNTQLIEKDLVSKVKHKVLIKQSQFLNNSATYGAGAFILSLDTFIDLCLFIDNKARMVAGGIFFSTSRNSERLTVKDSGFYGNKARLAGQIYTDGLELPKPNELGVEIEQASDPFDTGLEEGPRGLVVSQDCGFTFLDNELIVNSSTLVGELAIASPYKILGTAEKAKFIMFPSGQKISKYQYFEPINQVYIPYNLTFKLYIINKWNKRQNLFSAEVCNLNGETLDIQSNISLPIQGSFNAFSYNQVIYNIQTQEFNLDDLIINFNPFNKSQALKITFSCPFLQIPINDQQPPFSRIGYKEYELSVFVQTFPCQLGEFYDSKKQTCSLCDAEQRQYSVTQGATGCNLQNDATTLEIKPAMLKLKGGYWRLQVNSPMVEQCYHLQTNCEGGWIPGDLSCSVGHIGALCEQCDLYNVRGDGFYSISSKYSCAPCEKIQNNAISITAVSCWTFVSIFISVTGTAQTVESYILSVTIKFLGGAMVLSKTQSAILIKLFTNYLQILGMASTFSLDLPPGLSENLDRVSNPIETMAYSLDCSLKDLSDIPVVYFRNIWALLLPILYLAFFNILYGLAVVTKLTRFDITILTTSFVYIYIYMQPNLMGGLASLASFRIISNQRWVQGNVAYQYDSRNHIIWLLGFVMPSLATLGVMIPVLLFLWLYKRKNKLWQSKYRRILGYLYNEYSPNAYFWEIIKILQKQFMIFGLIYYEDYVPIKAAIIILLLFFYMRATQKLKPYLTTELNEIDQRSTVICSFSVVCASTIYSAQANHLIEIIWPFYIVMGLVNLLFTLELVLKIFINQFQNFSQNLDNLRIKIRARYPQLLKNKVTFKFLETTRERKARLDPLFQKLRDYLRSQARINIVNKLKRPEEQRKDDQIQMPEVKDNDKNIIILNSPNQEEKVIQTWPGENNPKDSIQILANQNDQLT